MTVTVTWPTPTLHRARINTAPVPSYATISPAQIPVYRPPAEGKRADYRLMVLRETPGSGTLDCLDELTDFTVTEVVERRNGKGEMHVRGRLDTTGAQHLVQRYAYGGPRYWTRGRLLQAWRQNHPLLLARPDDPSRDSSTGWYETDCVQHGPAEMQDLAISKRVEFQRNGGFEDGKAWWTPHNCTFDIDTSRKRRGNQAAKLTATAQESWIEQIRTLPGTVSESGNSARVSASCYLPAGSDFPAYFSGLVVEVRENNVFRAQQPDAGYIERRGNWVRFSLPFHTNPGVWTDVKIKLCAGVDPIWWDDVLLVRPDSTGVAPGGDASDAAAELARVTQVTNNHHWGRTVTPSGHIFENGWAVEHSEYPDVWDAMQDLTEWVDFGWVHNSRRSYGFRAWKPKTTPRRDLVLTPDNTVGLVFSNEADGAYSKVIILGEDDDYARDVGTAFDPAGFAGQEVTLVENAPPHSSPADLDAIAKKRLLRARDTPTFVDGSPADSGTAPVKVSAEWWHKIRCGDVLICEEKVHVNEIGTVVFRTLQRIETKRLDCIADTLSLELSEMTDA